MIQVVDANLTMFPAGAGMNRERQCLSIEKAHVPRRRGDEPGEELEAKVYS